MSQVMLSVEKHLETAEDTIAPPPWFTQTLYTMEESLNIFKKITLIQYIDISIIKKI